MVSAFPAQVRSIAEPEDVARRWRSVLAAHPGSARLWREYLAFRRAAFTTFGVAAVRREYEDALEVWRIPWRKPLITSLMRAVSITAG